MELNYLFDNFIKPKPFTFLKIISYNYTLKKEQILKYYPMLFWGRDELKASPNVNWDYDLSQRFEKQLTENYPTCWKGKEKNIHFKYLSLILSKIQDWYKYYPDS